MKQGKYSRTLQHIAANPARKLGSTTLARIKAHQVPAPLGRVSTRSAHLGRVLKRLNKTGYCDAAEALYVFCRRTDRAGAIFASEA